MANPSFNDLTAAISEGKLAPIYCLHGAETFLIDRMISTLRDAVVGKDGGFDADTFDLREQSLDAAVTAARTIPMFSQRRWVLAHAIDSVKASDFEPLFKYLAKPNPRACLVLVGSKVDGRLKAFLALKKAGYLHEFPRLKDRELSVWLTSEAKQRGFSIDPLAVTALAESAGPDLGRLCHALELISLYSNGRILPEHVDAMVPESRERSVFELTKAIATGSTTQALHLLANLLANREPALRIQFMLLRQLRQIWRAKELVARNIPRGEIASTIGIAPFFLDDILTPARKMSIAQLKQSYRRLYQTDRSLKSSRVDPDLQITRLVRQLSEDVEV
jgi:DNA polymerase-3 subunit delta